MKSMRLRMRLFEITPPKLRKPAVKSDWSLLIEAVPLCLSIPGFTEIPFT